MKTTLPALALLGAFALVFSPPAPADCTIGVANGIVTQDSRPLLWKSRMPSTYGRNIVFRDANSPYAFIGIKTVGDSNVNMGVNSAGLATGNTVIDSQGGNYPFTGHVLGYFATVPEVAEYIADPNHVTTVSGCFPFMDALGNTVMYEMHGGNPLFPYFYDALDPDRIPQDVYGFVIRANEWHRHTDGTDNLLIGGRYETGRVEVQGLISLNLLSDFTVMQGNNGAAGFEWMRYGPNRPPYADIANDSVSASMIVHGVAPDEDPTLDTMWIGLGHPNFTIAVPTWVAVADIPPQLGATPPSLYDLANTLRQHDQEVLTQASVFPVEARLFAEVNELMVTWRNSTPIALRDMPRVEWQMAADGYSLLARLGQDPNHVAPVVKIEMANNAAYIRFKAINLSIDDLGVNTCNTWGYFDDFSTERVEHDSYQHSQIVPEGIIIPQPFLCYTHVLYQPPDTLAFSPGGRDAAELLYRFPVFNEMPPVLAYVKLLVRNLQHGYGTYQLSADGVNWPRSGQLAFGQQRIDLMTGPQPTWRYFRNTVNAAGVVPLAHLWDFGDGETSTDPEVWHNFAPGTYLVTCTVTDAQGVSTTDYMYCTIW